MPKIQQNAFGGRAPPDPLAAMGPTSKGKFCTKFGYLTVRKIIKFVATRRQVLRLKCTKFNFGCGSAPDPAGGAYSAPPYP